MEKMTLPETPKITKIRSFAPKLDMLPCRVITLELTRRCNLKCVYCGAQGGRPLKNELSTSEIIRFLREAKNYGVKFIHLSGGEPLLRDDLCTIIDECSKLRFSELGITTNGTLFNKKCLDAINGFGGKFLIKISLDGASPKTNDMCRGVKGAFKQTLTTVKKCVSAGFDTWVLTTITKFNFEELPKIAKLVRKLGAKWSCGTLVPCGRGNKNMMDPVVKKFIKDISKQRQNFLNNIPPALKKFVKIKHHNWRLRYVGCAGGFSGFVVMPNGDVRPCGFLNISIGNIRHHNISHLWEKGFAKWRSSIDYSKNQECTSCPFFVACAGGCPAMSKAISGNIGGTPTPICAWCYELTDSYLRQARILIHGGRNE
jgi:radical SAM protein with 4Fe4S-binding SPASM domain